MLKGPGAFAWGGGALAGAVQVVRKHPVAARFADVTLAYGRYGTYEAAGDANLASRRRQAGVPAERASARGPTATATAATASIAGHQPELRLAARPGHARRRSPTSTCSSDQSPDSGLPVPERRARGPVAHDLLPVGRPTSPTRTSSALRLDAERRLNDTFVLRDKLYFSTLDWETDGTLVLGAFPFPDGNTYVPRTQGLLDDRQKLFGNQLELVASFHTGGAAHELVDRASRSSRMRTATRRTRSCCSRSTSRTRSRPTSASTRSRCRRRTRPATRRSLVIAPYLIDRITLLAEARAAGGRALRQHRLRGHGHRRPSATPRA